MGQFLNWGDCISIIYTTPLGIKTLACKSEFGQHYSFVRHLLPPAKTLNWGLIFWRRSHWAIAADCLAQLPHESRPTTSPDVTSLKVSGQLREFMRASKPSSDQFNRPLIKTEMAINCSARESHYSYRHFFCNIFFRFVSTESQLQKIVERSHIQRYFLVMQTSLE